MEQVDARDSKSAISALSNDLPQNEILHSTFLALAFWLIPKVSNLDAWVNKCRVQNTVFGPRNQGIDVRSLFFEGVTLPPPPINSPLVKL